MKTEREAFKAWVLNHPDNLNITSYEESTMFDAWQASAQREGYKLVAIDPDKQHIHKFEEITVNGDDARKYICIYCGFEKSESFNDH